MCCCFVVVVVVVVDVVVVVVAVFLRLQSLGTSDVRKKTALCP